MCFQEEGVCGVVSGLGDFLQPELTLSALSEPIGCALQRKKRCDHVVMDGSNNSDSWITGDKKA